VQDYQIIGGPGWLRSDGFDIDALTEATPTPPPPQFLLMIRTLLADRFSLVMHNEQRGSTPTDAVSIFTALQEQLGIKLEPARGPVDVLIIDGVAPPSEN